MQKHQRPGQRQAQARAFEARRACRMDLLKLGEGLRRIFLCDTDAGVGHGDRRPGSVLRGADRDVSARKRELHRDHRAVRRKGDPHGLDPASYSDIRAACGDPQLGEDDDLYRRRGWRIRGLSPATEVRQTNSIILVGPKAKELAAKALVKELDIDRGEPARPVDGEPLWKLFEVPASTAEELAKMILEMHKAGKVKTLIIGDDKIMIYGTPREHSDIDAFLNPPIVVVPVCPQQRLFPLRKRWR